jgi:hypothetical protein
MSGSEPAAARVGNGSIGLLSPKDAVITAATWFGDNRLSRWMAGFMAMPAHKHPKKFKALFQ